MKKILFLTGTRADFGKLKPLINAVDQHPSFGYGIFATGMHLMERYGNTIQEVHRAGFVNVFPYMNQQEGDSMDVILANTIKGLSRYLNEFHYDLIIVHGDRVEALAGAITGALNNILVGHVEGGEISGTVDELIRHSTSKLAHLHFVSTAEAVNRLIQMGEKTENIFNIGSPDVDVMFSDNLPTLKEVKAHYDIEFEDFSIAILHPVTTEQEKQFDNAVLFVDSLIESGENYIIIYPNNDVGSEEIFKAFEKFKGNKKIKTFPSLRFEFFLTLLKNANFIIGNSSAGIREAPVYGVPTINIGNRQSNRFFYKSIFNIEFNFNKIQKTIQEVKSFQQFPSCYEYGNGNSSTEFIRLLDRKQIWQINKQKQFLDLFSSQMT